MPLVATIIVCAFLACASTVPAQEFGTVPPDTTQPAPRPLYKPPVKVTFQSGVWGCVAGEQRGANRGDAMVSLDLGLQFFPKHRTVIGLGLYSENDDHGGRWGFKLSVRRWLDQNAGQGFYLQLAPALLVGGQDDHRQIETPVYHLDCEVGHSRFGAIAVGATTFCWTDSRANGEPTAGREISTYVGFRGNRWFAPVLLLAAGVASSVAD